jgi:hypothetical protein
LSEVLKQVDGQQNLKQDELGSRSLASLRQLSLLWRIFISRDLPGNLLRLEQVRISRHQEREDTFCDAHAMLNFPFPFLAPQTAAVCGFPTNRPHTENDTGCNDQLQLLLVYFATVAANLSHC